MEMFGFTKAQIEEYRNSIRPQHFDVLEENWNALRWFLDIDDLFRVDQGVVIGLDIQAIKADAEMAGREIKPQDYEKLRTIGRVAAAELNKKAQR